MAEHAQLAGRTQVASFARYADAERTVELLARTRFPLHHLCVVGGDLKLVTEPGATVTATRAGSVGVCGGLWMGALLVLFTFLVDRPPLGELLVRLLWGLPLGALFGGALGLAGYAILSGARDLTPRRHLVPARHELHVDAEVAASAWRLLLKLHPAGMTLVDRVPAQVVALPGDLVLIEAFESTETAAGPSACPTPSPSPSLEPKPESKPSPESKPQSRQQAQPPLRPVELPAL
jgi:hypothetical protein